MKKRKEWKGQKISSSVVDTGPTAELVAGWAKVLCESGYLPTLLGPVNVRNEQLESIFLSFKKNIMILWNILVLEYHEMFGCNKFYGLEYHDIAKIIVNFKF